MRGKNSGGGVGWDCLLSIEDEQILEFQVSASVKGIVSKQQL